jgi:peptide/nickel transport system ATP-binding protein
MRSVARHVFQSGSHETEERILGALAQVALRDNVVDQFPRELSEGERQRVAVARALLCEPSLLICDEITAALDVAVQAALLGVLQELQKKSLAILLITHNLGVVRAVADRVVVLRHGRVVEQGQASCLLDRPSHPYTRQLIDDVPTLF